MTKEQFEDLFLLTIGKSNPQYKIHTATISALAQTKAVEIINELRNLFVPIPSSFYAYYVGKLNKGLISLPISNIGREAIRSIKIDGYVVSVVANESDAEKYLSIDENEMMAWAEKGGIATLNVNDGDVKAYIIPDIMKMKDTDEMVGDEFVGMIMQRIKQELGIAIQLPEDKVNNG